MGFDPVKEGVIELGGISLSWFLSDSVIVVKSTKRSRTVGLSIIILQRRRASASGGAPTSGEGGQGDRDWVYSRVFIQGVECVERRRGRADRMPERSVRRIPEVWVHSRVFIQGAEK